LREIFVIVEHRKGEIRDITFEMLTKGRELARETETELTAILLGKAVQEHAKTLANYAAKVLLVEDPQFENFNSETYQASLIDLIRKHKPLLILIGHTSFGLELAPSLAVSDLKFEKRELLVTRQMYGGKVNVLAILQSAESYIATIRQAAFQSEKELGINGKIIKVESSISRETTRKKFIEYVMPPSGGVDITAADVLVGIGRGIKDETEISSVDELAKNLGGVLACSRPIVDKGWLPNDRQVGSSGKTVKPKLYIALGISGAFQHILGMKNADLIIAVNKDQNAPIFGVADYGIVDDLFKIVPALKNLSCVE
jgi:electron transfer flavoprotein alpha subunit